MHCFGYYGFYSNKSRGLRAKAELVELTQDTAEENNREGVNIIDVSKYQPKKVPSLTWCECIKKIWKQDPLIYPDCMGLMRIISFITQVFHMVSNETRRPRGQSTIRFSNTWAYGRRRLLDIRLLPILRRLCGPPSMMPEATCFLYINGKHLDEQYLISRILWVNISRVMSVVAKTGQLYSESEGSPAGRSSRDPITLGP
jgi:hypothetical protein